MASIDLAEAVEYNKRLGKLSPVLITKLVTLWQMTYGLDVDGKCGPQTAQSIADTSIRSIQAPDLPESANPGKVYTATFEGCDEANQLTIRVVEAGEK